MKRKPVEWLGTVDEESEIDARRMDFRVSAPWVTVNDEQLILPITLLDKSGVEIQEPYSAILKQYGGEGLLNDMLMSDQDLEEGSEWQLERYDALLTIQPL